ncbi:MULTISPECIES: NAD(P)-dependent oxidoreductase [unclassified Peribacillus]|uniref:NAD(P)-dependent oxidoreductase n=1 Tax=unclassified Peribacillus TaxID=2675266 RepID=UPI001911A26F|nr:MULTISPECIES: NAD(P)-dependent oxidoreductase [unclassified Peribacillus]MBK5445090.1 NAD(P)-dependent oxidoreductase [Peribacillus sp. TH24]MBK5460189.1 NAD(P)-dependent oxidoreductase [Peribacillus sp. TH27]MBK5498377.1 NAD(P)-dependent oxidoreductase [Peribacillus sp. TH14]
MKEFQTIAFIGLGNMGLPMATNLVKAGYTVYGVDTNSDAEKKFSQDGGKIGVPTELLAKQVDIVMTSLPTPQIVEKVYLGDGGIVENADSALTIIDFSTISPQLNEKIYAITKEKGIDYLGAPVSGSVSGAVNGTLTIMVGGDKKVYEQALPLLRVLGDNPFHLGESVGVGTVIKLLNNLMIGFYTQAVAEAVALGEQMGVKADTIYDVLSVSFGQSRIYERNYKGHIAQNNFNPGFSTNLLLKDLKLAKQMADENQTPLPIGDKLIDLYSEAVEKGYGEQDMASVYLMVKEIIPSKNDGLVSNKN